MAKAPWQKFVRTKDQMGLSRTKAPGKSPRDKMLAAIDAQIANIAGQTLSPKAAWYQGAGDKGYRVKPRYGTTSLPLGDEDIYVYANELEPFLKALREEVAKGGFDAELEAISKRMSEGKRGKGKKATV